MLFESVLILCCSCYKVHYNEYLNSFCCWKSSEVWAGILGSWSLKVCSQAGTKAKTLTSAQSLQRSQRQEIDGASWVTESISLLKQEHCCKCLLVTPECPCRTQIPQGTYRGSSEGASASPVPFTFRQSNPLRCSTAQQWGSTSTCTNNFDLR